MKVLNKDITVKFLHDNFGSPIVCPSCGSELVIDGVHLWCKNKECKDKIIYQIVCFIKKLGVKFSSNKSLDKFEINSFKDLINFKPNEKYKSEVKLFNEIKNNVFTKSKEELLSALNFQGLSEILINKIIDFYGYDTIENKFEYVDLTVNLPDGVGPTTINKFIDSLDDNLRIIDMITSHELYVGSKHERYTSSINKNGKSVCFTGTLNSMSRNEAIKKAELFGFDVKSTVTKNLTYLVNNDIESKSSKNKKALQLGIKIITETQFLDMISHIDKNSEDNLFSL